MHVALLEDDTELGQLIKLWLEGAGLACDHFVSGRALMARLRDARFDMLILDWMVEDLSGEEVLRSVRARGDWQTPILFATARDAEEDVVNILSAGADDYMTKPVRQSEFLARVQALARRVRARDAAVSDSLHFGNFVVDTKRREIRQGESLFDLTAREFDLAVFLFRHVGQLIPRGHLLKAVWGHPDEVQTRTLDTHMSRIRTKLGLRPENGWRLTGIYQYGYRLEQIQDAAAVA